MAYDFHIVILRKSTTSFVHFWKIFLKFPSNHIPCYLSHKYLLVLRLC
nr:MAG TPA: hypothetical protein [Caudoviricetes sp.]